MLRLVGCSDPSFGTMPSRASSNRSRACVILPSAWYRLARLFSEMMER